MSFTLLEVLLALWIVSIIGVVVSLNGVYVIHNIKSMHSRAALYEELMLSKIVEVSYDIDIYIELTSKGRGVEMTRLSTIHPNDVSWVFCPKRFYGLQLREELKMPLSAISDINDFLSQVLI